MSNLNWQNIGNLPSRSYSCGYCSKALASQMGWYAHIVKDPHGSARAHIYVCHFCNQPTFFDENSKQHPGSITGHSVADINDEGVLRIYEEARVATGHGCFTAAVLCCRKLLMNIAVAKGASAGQPFISYVEFLAEKGFVPPDAKAWVDHIRTMGNEATHEIAIGKEADATELLEFSGMLLKFIFEFPATMQKKYNTAPKSLANIVPKV